MRHWRANRIFTMPKADSLSFGERLRVLREEAGLSVEQLAEKTKIQRKHLAALEAEDFHALPPAVYIRGFVNQWARVCGGDAPEALMHLDRIQALLASRSVGDRRLERLSKPFFVITLRHILVCVGILVGVGVGAYFGYQYLVLMRTPFIEISSPTTMETVQQEQWATIEGQADRVASLTIAGQEVYVEKNGYFRHEVPLNEGVNMVRIQGRGENGDEIEVMRKIVRIP